MSLNTILLAVVIVGVAGWIMFEAVKSISEEFDFEIISIGFPKLALPKFSQQKWTSRLNKELSATIVDMEFAWLSQYR